MNIILPKFKCWSPINIEGSWGGRNISKKAESEFEFMNDGFEWVIDYGDEDDDVTYIGTIFEGFPPAIIDYDGVMSFPAPLIRWLDMNGINTDYFGDDDRDDSHIEYEWEFVLAYCQALGGFVVEDEIALQNDPANYRWKFVGTNTIRAVR